MPASAAMIWASAASRLAGPLPTGASKSCPHPPRAAGPGAPRSCGPCPRWPEQRADWPWPPRPRAARPTCRRAFSRSDWALASAISYWEGRSGTVVPGRHLLVVAHPDCGDHPGDLGCHGHHTPPPGPGWCTGEPVRQQVPQQAEGDDHGDELAAAPDAVRRGGWRTYPRGSFPAYLYRLGPHLLDPGFEDGPAGGTGSGAVNRSPPVAALLQGVAGGAGISWSMGFPPSRRQGPGRG